ncbi:SRSO17 transposase [Pseudonocardia parietis]|uniref:SRSO17 transposase n=1 Tax=Pseudonocardia parietis TaxID=570936 RepID=A0ABS4W5Z3_9PSEU|nr:IS701 family transposase [Pseudonocardia parietis]MBP2371629.1 SRSO17 transposase [Pseudonocardia parietis]MBP2371890.1 SRSO17 transposase [Pseudonocardia parietis]MBP2371950.1 SRSO17 transposase [Pseudonocardia parietis]
MDLAGWVAALDEVIASIGPRFFRREPRGRAGTYVRGLLAGLERKNGWTLAEHAGAMSPDSTQRLLRTADWDVDGVRDDVRDYALDALGDPASGVFVVDETGFVKKGVRSAGVQRQYTGTTGKIDNCQLGVFLAYASSRGRALIDRELYLPTSWTEDRDRCAKADVPDEVGFATKPQLGLAMLDRAHATGLLAPGSWVTADEAYGQNPTFRTWLADREMPFVLATRNDDVLRSPDGHRRQAKILASIAGARDPDTGRSGWERRSVGAGAHGDRDYDWTVVTLDPAGLPAGWGHWLLVRRQTEPGEGKTLRELAFYRCAAPSGTPLRELVRVAGARWAIEECFQTAKNEAGLDQYQVRSYRAWYAHITLAMLAAAYLAATRTREAEKGGLHPTTIS